MNIKHEPVSANSYKKKQGPKGKGQPSYTEKMYSHYFNKFWREYTADYIAQVEKDNSNQIREQNCKEKFINVSSIIRYDQADQSANMSLGRILHDVGQEKKVNYELTPQKPEIQRFTKEKNLFTMKKKLQTEVVEVGKDIETKFEVKLPIKKQILEQQEEKVQHSAIIVAKIDNKALIASKKIDVEPTGMMNLVQKESNQLIVKTQNQSNGVDTNKLHVQPTKQSKKYVVDQQAKLLDSTKSIKTINIQKPITDSEMSKNSEQVPKTLCQQQEQEEVIDDQTESIYNQLNMAESKLQVAQQIEVQNQERIESDLSQTRNTTNSQANTIEIQEEYINQSSQKFIGNREAVKEEPVPSEDKRSGEIKDNSSENQKRRENLILTQSNDNKIDTVINENNNLTQNHNQKQDRRNQMEVQEQVDQNHFVTCITEDSQLQIQNPAQFESKMSGIQDYQSYSNVAILQEQEVSESKLLDQSVDKIVQDFLNLLQTKNVILDKKILTIKDKILGLQLANQKLSDEKQEMAKQNQQLNANLFQANKKNTQLTQNLQKEKKQNFDYKIKIQQMEAKIKELQEKDIFNNSQLINLSQGIKRNRSEQALLQNNDSSCNSNQVKEQKKAHDSEEESEKNPSDYSANQNEAKEHGDEDQNQKNSSDEEQQSKQNTKNIHSSQKQSKIQPKKEVSQKSSQS